MKVNSLLNETVVPLSCVEELCLFFEMPGNVQYILKFANMFERE